MMWNASSQRTATMLLAALVLCVQLFAERWESCNCGSIAKADSQVACCEKISLAATAESHQSCCSRSSRASESCCCETLFGNVSRACGCGCFADKSPASTTDVAKSTRSPRQPLGECEGVLPRSLELAGVVEQNRQYVRPPFLVHDRPRQIFHCVWQI